MIDYSLRECPFCGNPAEIVEGEPFSFMPKTPTKRIRCSNEYGCPGYYINIRYQPDLDISVERARGAWNKRKRKNKNTWRYRNDDD